MYKIIKNCRICGSNELKSIFNLGNQFLTGVFPKSASQIVECGPVELVQCSSPHGCGLVQLRQSYSPDEMYGDNYGYRSGLNPSMKKHLNAKVNKIIDMNLLSPGDLIIDIGSNDATTLKFYPQDRYELVGIDPSGKKFSKYYNDSIILINDFFSSKLFNTKFSNKKAKIITSFSMFYDLEDPLSFVKDIENILSDQGLWIFEQSYLPSMLKQNSFDTICHEHLEFYSLTQINWLLNKSNLKIVDVEFNDVNGGSFSVTAAKINSKINVNSELINNILKEESLLELNSSKSFDEFIARIDTAKNKLLDFLTTCRAENKTVCGIGASTKGNVLLQYYNIDSSLVKMIGEVNEDKFGTFTPGSLIPIVSEIDMLKSNPDYIIVLPWHFRSFFESLPDLKGRNLIFPLPNFEIVKL